MSDIVEAMAKLGLVSEENSEKFVRSFVKIKEGIRVFKGATDMFWKGREALVALSTATKAQTALNNLMAVSSARAAVAQGVVGATAVSGGGRKAGGGAGGVALGVASNLAIGAAGAKLSTGGGGVLASAQATGASVVHGAGVFTVLAAELAGAAAAGLGLFEGIQGLRKLFGDTSESSELFTHALMGWWEESGKAEKSTEKLTRKQKEHLDLLSAMNRYESQERARSGFQRDLRSAGNRFTEARTIASGETGIQQADRARLEAVREVRATEMAIVEDQKRQKERVAKGQFFSKENELRLLKEAEAAQINLYNAEVNRLNVIRDQNKATVEVLKTERERLVNAKETKRLEDRSLNAKLGQLNPGLRDQATEVAKKIKAGQELDRRDIAIINEAGVGQEYVTDFYEKKGKRAVGSDVFTEVFGSKKTKQEISDTEKKIEKNQTKLTEGKIAESAAGQNVISTAELTQQATEARVRYEAALKLGTEIQIKGLQENAKLVQQASADAADAIHQQGMATVDSIKTMQEAMVKSQQDMKMQFDQFLMKQNEYKQA